MNYSDFEKTITKFKQDVYRETLADNRNTIRVTKEETVIRNLERIFEATLRLSNDKGFQAMSMRDLACATGLSSGGLYAYFTGKTELLEMLLHHGRNVIQRILVRSVADETDPASMLRAAIRTHLHLSEYMQPWFYFSYMEAKNLSKADREKAIESELATERLLADILEQGRAESFSENIDVKLTAGVLKAMVQDWYLKRWKFAKRNVSVDQYADFVLEFSEAYLGTREPESLRPRKLVQRSPHDLSAE